jgi:hypothetical protein
MLKILPYKSMTSVTLYTGIISIYATLAYKKITNIVTSNPGF